MLIASLFLLTLISADICNPDSGYNKCYDSSNVEEYGDCRAFAWAEIQGQSDIQVENGEIEYNNGKYYATGPTYIKYNIDKGKYGLVYENAPSWDWIWDQYDCDKYGCNFYNYEQGKYIEHDNKYYLTKNKGDSYSGCPVFIAFDHDLEEKSSCWAWSTIGQGWGWTGDGGCKKVEQVECLSDNECGTSEYVSDKYCKDDNVVRDYKEVSCSNYNCGSKTIVKTMENCDYGCENSECLNLEEPSEPEISSISKFVDDLWNWITSII